MLISGMQSDTYCKCEAAGPVGAMPGKLRSSALLHHVPIGHKRKDAKGQSAVQLAIRIAAYHGKGLPLTKVKPVLIAFR